jgi:hypothetical protein
MRRRERVYRAVPSQAIGRAALLGYDIVHNIIVYHAMPYYIMIYTITLDHIMIHYSLS